MQFINWVSHKTQSCLRTSHNFITRSAMPHTQTHMHAFNFLSSPSWNKDGCRCHQELLSFCCFPHMNLNSSATEAQAVSVWWIKMGFLNYSTNPAAFEPPLPALFPFWMGAWTRGIAHYSLFVKNTFAWFQRKTCLLPLVFNIIYIYVYFLNKNKHPTCPSTQPRPPRTYIFALQLRKV